MDWTSLPLFLSFFQCGTCERKEVNVYFFEGSKRGGIALYLVRHVRTLHKTRFAAILAHKRDADGIEHGFSVVVLHVHHLTVITRVLHRSRDADQSGVFHQKQRSCANHESVYKRHASAKLASPMVSLNSSGGIL